MGHLWANQFMMIITWLQNTNEIIKVKNDTIKNFHYYFKSWLFLRPRTILSSGQFSSLQPLNHARPFVTPWTAACQDSFSVTTSRSLIKLMLMNSVIPSNQVVLCYPLLLLPSTFLSIKVFSNNSVLRIRWPRYWGFSFSISPSNEYSGLISFRID